MEERSKWFVRFAITPRCNFRCTYCNPKGNKEISDTVSEDDIIRIISGVHKAGVNRVHWTGGEPTLMDLERLVKTAKDIGFVEQVMTTNGSKGGRYLRSLADKGLNRLIVSLDTLNPERFRNLTRSSSFYEVLGTIEQGVAIFSDPTKMNIVYMEETKKEVPAFVEFSRRVNTDRNGKGKLIIKFIEMSQNNPAFFDDDGQNLYRESHSSREELISLLSDYGSMERVRVRGNNPNTEYYRFPELGIDIGLITIPSLGYKCGGEGCTKIRLNPYGAAGVCISQEPVSLMHKSEDKAAEIFRGLIEYKAVFARECPDRKHYKGEFGFWRFGDCKGNK
ncbi:MAG: radical SAM protein [Nanoarchaeota archaeon]|nr:radical SAM protein [Nanoarchaeota archaeon]